MWWPNADPVIFDFQTRYDRKLKYIPEFEKTCSTIKAIFSKAGSDTTAIRRLIDDLLIPTDDEKKMNGEVSTPFETRNNMLDTIPPSFWTNKSHTVFDPCCGKGGFVVDVFAYFFKGLEPSIPDAEERRKWILEHCLYFADISTLNVFITRKLLDPYDEYSLLDYIGDTLTVNIKSTFNVDKFDLVVANPPYSTDLRKINSSKPLYHLFAQKYIPLSSDLVHHSFKMVLWW